MSQDHIIDQLERVLDKEIVIGINVIEGIEVEIDDSLVDSLILTTHDSMARCRLAAYLLNNCIESRQITTCSLIIGMLNTSEMTHV